MEHLSEPHTPHLKQVYRHVTRNFYMAVFFFKKKNYYIFISFVITGKSAVAAVYVRRSVLSLPCGIIRLSSRALSPAEPSHSPCFLSKTCATAQPYYTKDAGGGFAMPMHICMHIHMYRCTHVQVGGVAHARKVHVSMRVEVRRQPQVLLSEQLSVCPWRQGLFLACYLAIGLNWPSSPKDPSGSTSPVLGLQT